MKNLPTAAGHDTDDVLKQLTAFRFQPNMRIGNWLKVPVRLRAALLRPAKSCPLLLARRRYRVALLIQQSVGNR
jgi:hypothetical protein